MRERILCVDDDSHVLDAYQRTLRTHYAVDVALSAMEALSLLRTQGPYAVVISDMRMPVMDGLRFLVQVRDEHPRTVRIMLTGNNDQRTAIDGVNAGGVFRFLTKPCPMDVLALAVADGVQQYRLQLAEREVLEQTLGGCIRLLLELLSLSDPQTFARARGMRERIRTLTGVLGQGDAWEVETAAMLAPIGATTIPPVVLLKSRIGRALSYDEQDMLTRVPATGHRLLAAIPRLEGVARIVLYQDKRFDGSGFPADEVAGGAIPVGARLLLVLADLARLEAEGFATAQAIARLGETPPGRYDPVILAAVRACLGQAGPARVASQRHVRAGELRLGQVLRSDIRSQDGQLLLSSGHVLNEPLLERLANSARVHDLIEPIMVEDSVATDVAITLPVAHPGA